MCELFSTSRKDKKRNCISSTRHAILAEKQAFCYRITLSAFLFPVEVNNGEQL